jgi:hypothetical protein
MSCPPGTRVVFAGTRSERCVPAVGQAPSTTTGVSPPITAGAGLATTGLAPCRWWQRLAASVGLPQRCDHGGRRPSSLGRVVAMGAIVGGALLVGSVLLGDDDDDGDDEE